MKNTSFRSDIVSCVTPVYNGEHHLSNLLDSLLTQSYPLMEIILTDDGSTDGTLQVAESYREAFAARGYEYRIVRAEHKNASAAINSGLPYVRGEYLIWPDSDDVLAPDSVEKRVTFLRENPHYQCVRSLADYFDAKTGEPCQTPDERQGDLSKEELFWDVLESKTFVCCGCYMLRTAAFFAIYPQRRIPEYDVGQNFQMLLPFLYRHRCPTLREALYGVCVREGSHSRIRLTQAEEKKKYDDYERLIDDIAALCRIEDEASKKRIACWKAKRKCYISLKYGCKKEALRALYRLYRCGGLHISEIFLFFLRQTAAFAQRLPFLFRAHIDPPADKANRAIAPKVEKNNDNAFLP